MKVLLPPPSSFEQRRSFEQKTVRKSRFHEKPPLRKVRFIKPSA